MWTSIRSMEELNRRGRWKVEFFSGDIEPRREFAYPAVPIRDLVVERRETLNPQQFPERRFNYLGLENVESATGDLIGVAQCVGADIKSRSKVFRAGDILYGRLRPNLNKVYVACGDVDEGICSGEFYVLTPDQSRIRPTVLRALLASSYVQDHVAAWLTGAALPRLQLSDLLGVAIPCPPLGVQDELEAFISACDTRRRLARRLVATIPGILSERLTASLSIGSSIGDFDSVLSAVLSE